jgi:hypothetical protein
MAGGQTSYPFVWFPLAGGVTPLIRVIAMYQSVSRCGVCAELFIHGALRGTWNGSGRPVNSVGMRRAGLWGLGREGELQSLHELILIVEYAISSLLIGNCCERV